MKAAGAVVVFAAGVLTGASAVVWWASHKVTGDWL